MTDPADGAPTAITIEAALSDEDVAILRGALLAARATERSELRRRAGRLSLGYGSESARESMDAETRRLHRRIELLNEVLAALDRSTSDRNRG